MFDVEPRAAANATIVANYAAPGTSCSRTYPSELTCTVASDKQEKVLHPTIQHKHYSQDNIPIANPMRLRARCFCASVVLRLAQTQSPEERYRRCLENISPRMQACHIGSLALVARRTFGRFGVVLSISTSTSFCLVNPLGQAFRPLVKHHASARACRTRKM